MSRKNAFITTTPAPQHGLDSHDLSHEKKLSFKLGQLVPIYWDDITPGDIFRVNSEIFVRFAPLLAPILQRINLFVHYFWVPYRLLMRQESQTIADWEQYITGDPESEVTTESVPYVTLTNVSKQEFQKGNLCDYLGLPIEEEMGVVTQDVDLNCMPQMAYQLIYDNYYRDQNLQSKICGLDYDITMQGGDRSSQIAEINQLRTRNYEKDYFTGALPTAYAGSSSDVELDLDVYGLGAAGGYSHQLVKAAEAVPGIGDSKFDGANPWLFDAGGAPLYPKNTIQGYTATLEIYELRRAQALTRSLEAEQRGGKRYVEMLLGKFGVVSDDYRIAIPQYLGGGKQYVQVSEVANASQTLDPTAGVNDGVGGVTVTVDPQANMAGSALSVGSTNQFKKRFTEHGVVMGIMSVLPRTSYMSQGIERYWRKTTDRYDFFDPFLQGIGDQAIDQSEVYWDDTGTDMDDVFGYTPRWAEYKFKNSTVHGDFRDDFDYWHMGIKFTSAPSLNSAFIAANYTRDEMNRIFAVETASVDKLYAQVYNNVRALRQMKIHDIPK